jgi:hypothetical protein
MISSGNPFGEPDGVGERRARVVVGGQDRGQRPPDPVDVLVLAVQHLVKLVHQLLLSLARGGVGRALLGDGLRTPATVIRSTVAPSRVRRPACSVARLVVA